MNRWGRSVKIIGASGNEDMTYQVFYGHALAMEPRDRHLDERVRSERFSTEHEALNRARELLDQDFSTVVAIHDASGNEVTGVSLQLRLGYSCVE
jgi:hypothetical protein